MTGSILYQFSIKILQLLPSLIWRSSKIIIFLACLLPMLSIQNIKLTHYIILRIFLIKVLYYMLKTLPPIVGVNNRTFVIDSCDQVVGTVLKEHGWKQIPTNSVSWNLKWTWKADNKSFEALQTGQFINHFQGSDQISTKLGLSLLYKSNPIILDSGKSFQTFYPRSFNLSTEKQEFINNFIQTGILNFLKKIVVCLELFHPTLFQQITRLKQKYTSTNTATILTLLFNNQQISVSQPNTEDRLKINGKLIVRLLFYLENIFSLEQSYNFNKQELIELVEYGKQQIPFPRTQSQITPTSDLLCLLLIYHDKCMKTMTNFYQDGFSNIWIVKSNHSSRGRNILLIDSLQDVEAIDNGMKLVQKYIENIWVLHEMDAERRQKHPEMFKLVKKKFDIRFWVLVKSFSPLIVYIYDEAYLRISAESYRLDTLTEKQSHLTNYSINWKCKESIESSSYVLFSKFLNFLSQQEQVEPAQIRRKIDTIIIQTLKLVEIKKDQKCFELFGFDVILDAKLNPWILQCNMSPACAPRGELKNLVKNMTTGLLSILGFINTGIDGWRQLHCDQHNKVNKQATSCRSFRETTQNFMNRAGNILRMRTTMNNWNDPFLLTKKLEWKKYKIIEKTHYYIEKVQLLQRFFRTKLQKIERKRVKVEQKRNVNKCLKMLQVLARLTKNKKTKYFKQIQKLILGKVKQRNKFRINF